jgi:1-acyl-sn-glycerol-3-phosphate acyltransferase
MRTFAKIRFYYGAAVISFIAAAIMVPLMAIFSKNRSIILYHCNRMIMFFLGGKIITHGQQDKNANIYIMNHQGIIDIISIEAAQKSDLRWVAKKQLFDAPWFGYVLKLPKMIQVDREDKAGLVKLLRDIKETSTDTEKHRIVAIFPEGTRTEEQALLDFKGGTKIVAEKLQLTVQPIVITNSKRLLNEHNRTAHSATVHINYMDSFKVSKENKGWYDQVREEMQRCIDNEYNEYKRER